VASGIELLRQDAELVRRIRAGEPAAEELLCRRFEPGLRAMALVRAGRGGASDLVQETLTLALGNLRQGKWRGDGELASYLAAILRHRVARALRPRGREVEAGDLDGLPASDGDPQATATRVERQQRVRQALQQLSQDHREVVVRHYFDDQSVGRIARDLGLPRGTVLSRLHYARKAIARRLNRRGGREHSVPGKASAG